MRNKDEETAEERRYAKIGEFIDAVGAGRGVGALEGARVTGITLRWPTEEEPSTLLVIRATSGTAKWVAFVGAYSAGDAVLAWRKRSLAGRMKWREDLPWERREG